MNYVIRSMWEYTPNLYQVLFPIQPALVPQVIDSGPDPLLLLLYLSSQHNKKNCWMSYCFRRVNTYTINSTTGRELKGERWARYFQTFVIIIFFFSPPIPTPAPTAPRPKVRRVRLIAAVRRRGGVASLDQRHIRATIRYGGGTDLFFSE